MSSRLDRLITAIVAVSAVAVAAAAVYGAVIKPAPRTVRDRRPPEFTKGWEQGLAIARLAAGDSAAAATIMVLVDLECPACRQLQLTLEALTSESPKRVRVLYVHYPLTYHRFAFPAARASECAASTGAFAQFTHLVYAKQDSLGLKSWGSFAREAGIADTARIVKCAMSSALVDRVESGLAFGKRVGVASLPTVIVNGWKMSGVPSRTEIDSVLTALSGSSR